MPVTGNCNR